MQAAELPNRNAETAMQVRQLAPVYQKAMPPQKYEDLKINMSKKSHTIACGPDEAPDDDLDYNATAGSYMPNRTRARSGSGSRADAPLFPSPSRKTTELAAEVSSMESRISELRDMLAQQKQQRQWTGWKSAAIDRSASRPPKGSKRSSSKRRPPREADTDFAMPSAVAHTAPRAANPMAQSSFRQQSPGPEPYSHPSLRRGPSPHAARPLQMDSSVRSHSQLSQHSENSLSPRESDLHSSTVLTAGECQTIPLTGGPPRNASATRSAATASASTSQSPAVKLVSSGTGMETNTPQEAGESKEAYKKEKVQARVQQVFKDVAQNGLTRSYFSYLLECAVSRSIATRMEQNPISIVYDESYTPAGDGSSVAIGTEERSSMPVMVTTGTDMVVDADASAASDANDESVQEACDISPMDADARNATDSRMTTTGTSP